MKIMSNSGKCEKYSWNKFSESKLISLEKKILEVVKTAYKGWFVPIDTKNESEEHKIWTISLNDDSKNTPLVLLHGFGAGLGFWCLNFDALAKDRPVYAIDILGFGRSSRPNFSNNAEQAEIELVASIEEWRKKINLERFILLGHSFGGYLATSYAIKYPDHIKHLILADPWGFNERPPDYNPPLFIKTLAVIFYPFKFFNPLATVRAAGPIGPWLVKKTRSDLAEKYAVRIEDREVISEYIYQCNSQKPSGESAFHTMVKGFGWAKNPMVHRVKDLRQDVPMTVIYGEESWIDKKSGIKIREIREDSYVELKIVDGAGHHLHADEPESFNKMVVEACSISDLELDIRSDFPETDKKENYEEEDNESPDITDEKIENIRHNAHLDIK